MTNLYRVNHAKTCALIFALTPLSNVSNRRELLMTCSTLQDRAMVQSFVTADVVTHIFHSISIPNSSLVMEHRQIEAG
jgi:hypothetical protein